MKQDVSGLGYKHTLVPCHLEIVKSVAFREDCTSEFASRLEVL